MYEIKSHIHAHLLTYKIPELLPEHRKLNNTLYLFVHK